MPHPFLFESHSKGAKSLQLRAKSIHHVCTGVTARNSFTLTHPGPAEGCEYSGWGPKCAHVNPQGSVLNLASSLSLQSSLKQLSPGDTKTQGPCGLCVLREALTKEGEERGTKTCPTAEVSQPAWMEKIPMGSLQAPRRQGSASGHSGCSPGQNRVSR